MEKAKDKGPDVCSGVRAAPSIGDEKWAHTPGPWMWDSDPMKDDPYNRVRYRVVARGKTITQIYYSTYEGGPTNAEWDARLIAAAPDLYEIAKARENDLIERHAKEPDAVARVLIGDEIIKTRAALTKAKP